MGNNANFPFFNNYLDDAVSVISGNLRCTSASYWSSADSYIEFPSTGKWFIETYVGNTYAAYPAQGFYSQTTSRFDQVGRAIYYGAADADGGAGEREGLGVDMNSDRLGYYVSTDAPGASSVTFKEPDGTTIYSTNTKIVAHALDMDNERYWAGSAFSTSTAYTWFGNSNSSTGGDDPTDATTGLDISGWISANSISRVRFAHAPNNVAADPYAVVNFGQDSTFLGAMTAGTSSDANGYGNFKFALPSGYLALCTANYSEDNFGFITNTTFKGNASSTGPVVFLNGPPDSVTINSNTVTFGTHAEKLACGFRIITSSTSYNSTGTNTVVATAAGPVWKYANAQYRTT